MSAQAGPGGPLAELAARLGAYAGTQAKLHPGARVRLLRPLQAPPAAARWDALLGLERGSYAGGAEPRPPYAPTLAGFQEQISGCLRCPLGGQRKRMVFGEGDPHAPLVFVGAAPGGDEEASGGPLAGAAGQLFDRMLAAMGLQRPEVYVCNILKCRPSAPPAGKALDRMEVEACRPFLEHQLSLLRPRALVALGSDAAALLLGSGEALSALRGRWGSFKGLKVMPTYHPRDLLRDAGLKRHVWEDLKLVLKLVQAPAEP